MNNCNDRYAQYTQYNTPQHGIRNPIDRLEVCLAKEVDEKIHAALGCYVDVRVTVEINNPFLIIEIAADCQAYSNLRCFDLRGAIGCVLNSEGFAHEVRRTNYGYAEGTHTWSVLVELKEPPMANPCGSPCHPYPIPATPVIRPVLSYPAATNDVIACENTNTVVVHNHIDVGSLVSEINFDRYYQSEKTRYESWLQEIYNDSMRCSRSQPRKTRWSLYC